MSWAFSMEAPALKSPIFAITQLNTSSETANSWNSNNISPPFKTCALLWMTQSKTTIKLSTKSGSLTISQNCPRLKIFLLLRLWSFALLTKSLLRLGIWGNVNHTSATRIHRRHSSLSLAVMSYKRLMKLIQLPKRVVSWLIT